MEYDKIIAVTVVGLLLLAGAVYYLGDDEDQPEPKAEDDTINYSPVVEDPESYYADDDVRLFEDLDPIDLFNMSARQWAVFKKERGGNCCEHYLATTKEGWIVNLGGEYPVWSEDRGQTWKVFSPDILDQDTRCRGWLWEVKDGQGLGEGSVVQTTTGDLIAMAWYPYPSIDGKADRFYSYLYEQSTGEWSYCQNNWFKEVFYDRSWQVEVKGPITQDIYGLPGNWPYASIVVSNFWRGSINEGAEISVDGLNYDKLDLPSRNSNPDPVTFDLNFTDLGVEWDYAMPHREMRAIPLPGEENGGPGGTLFPNYFNDGTNAWLDTELNWHKHTVSSGTPVPSEFLWLDSSSALHSLIQEGNGLTHYISYDGGNSWNNSYTHEWPYASDVSDDTFEWEFQVDGQKELAMIFMRVQTGEDDNSAADRDLLYQIRGYRESMAADSVTLIGKGDLDSTSGAGNDIRFDFASMGILPDGGAVVAYTDSTDNDPLFAVEVELPEEYL